VVEITFCHGQFQTVAFWIRCRFNPSGQGQDAGGFRLISILVEHQDRYDRFAMITGADDQL
jgi:hypothetical protein